MWIFYELFIKIVCLSNCGNQIVNGDDLEKKTMLSAMSLDFSASDQKLDAQFDSTKWNRM